VSELASKDPTAKVIALGRILLTLALIPVGRRMFGSWDDPTGIPMIGDIDLAIHEFGHMLFMPFGIPILGETMVIMGGSLTQIALPLVFAGYFVFSKKHRDLHAATVCFWWAAVNVADVAIYAHDARARQLMLISGTTGQESDGHDFYNLFAMWGVLERDVIYAARMRALAGFMMFVATLGGLFAAVTPLMRPKDSSRVGELESP
jgi:hypothetical protein